MAQAGHYVDFVPHTAFSHVSHWLVLDLSVVLGKGGVTNDSFTAEHCSPQTFYQAGYYGTMSEWSSSIGQWPTVWGVELLLDHQIPVYKLPQLERISLAACDPTLAQMGLGKRTATAIMLLQLRSLELINCLIQCSEVAKLSALNLEALRLHDTFVPDPRWTIMRHGAKSSTQDSTPLMPMKPGHKFWSTLHV